MKKKQISMFAALLLASAALIGCDNSGDNVFERQVVLGGLMYVSQPPSVDLSYSIPIEQRYERSAVLVHDAFVQVTVRDTLQANPTDTLTLTEDFFRPGTYVFWFDTVRTSFSYSIYVRTADGEELRASTPAAAAPIHIDSTNMDSIEYGETPFFLRWNIDPVHNVGYTMLIQNLEPDWAEDYRPVSGNNGPDMTPATGWFTRSDSTLEVAWVVLGFTGRHRVLLMSSDQPWWDYFYSTRLGTAENYPQSNVTGGLGIFAAVGVDTAYFYLTDYIKDEP
jgi:hypothetical protein